jgi:glycosyltransferase involved in cell wall biosynthesis
VRLLIWTQYFWPENFAINEVARELVAQGVEVTVLTGNPNYPSGRVQPGYKAFSFSNQIHEGIRIRRLPLYPRRKGRPIDLVINYLSFVVSGYAFSFPALKNEQFDALLVYAPSPLIQALPAIFFSSVKKIPMALWVQDLWPEALKATGYVSNPFFLRIVGGLVNFIYKYVDLILIQSEAYRKSIELRTVGHHRIRYHPNAASASQTKITPDPSLAAILKEFEDCFSIVFAGNVGRAQACHVILNASKRLPDKRIKFFVVGDGSMLKSLRDDVRESGVTNVVFIDRLAPAHMPEVFSRASALLVTLAKDSDLSLTVPSKLLSYFAAAKPIIACTDGETARIVNASGAGLVCSAEDPVQLANTVLELQAMSDDQRQVFCDNSRRYFLEHFSLQTKTRELIELLRFNQ